MGLFGSVNTMAQTLKNVKRALEESKLEYNENGQGTITLSAMGDDLPIGMVIIGDAENMTLNIYCYLMFEIPADARAKLIPELNHINNSINNGSFYMDDNEPKIYFKIVQSLIDGAPSVKLLKHLIFISFQTVDVNDGKLKDLIPADALRKDVMYS